MIHRPDQDRTDLDKSLDYAFTELGLGGLGLGGLEELRSRYLLRSKPASNR